MKSRPRPSLSRLGLATLASLVPSLALADATVFSTNFTADTIHAAAPAITPTATNWYIMSSKNATSTNLGDGLVLVYAPGSTAAGVQGVARFTNSPLSLSAVGDSITARASVYTDKVLNLAFGLYNSNGVNPLTTLQNTGLSGAIYSGPATDGTFGWEGYRARVGSGSTAGSIIARPVQTGASLAQANFDLLAVNTGDFASPGPISVGLVPNSDSSVTFEDGAGSQYHLTYTITRTATDTLSISYTIRDDADTLLYSTSSLTTTQTARPSAITSTFDAVGIGDRNNASTGSTVSTLWVKQLSVTASNAQVPLIAHQPVAQSWVSGVSGSISVAATGAAPLTYQWYKDGSPLGSGTSATYTVASPSASDAGSYHVVVSNAYGTITSQPTAVALASPSAANITVEPTGQNVNEGEQLTLSVTATGAPTPAYQWYKGSSPISGATYPSHTVARTVAADAGAYHVVVSNGSSDTSVTVNVAINSAAPAVTLDPIDTTVNVGQPIALAATFTGYPAPTYQWFKNTGSGFTPIAGATDSIYTVPAATTAADIGAYHVVATNYIDSATSAAATVTVNVVAPTITTEPTSTTVDLGLPASFTVVASGSPPLSYQWYKGSTPIDGATSATYNTGPTTGASAGNYHVVVTNESGVPATSATATLDLIVTENTPVLTTNFADDTINPMTTEAPIVPNPVITPTSTAWYVLSSKTATNSRMLDDNPDTAAVADPAYELILNAPSGSAFFQTATRFSATPISLAQIGTQLRLTTTFTTRNINSLGFGFYNSGGSWPVQLDFEDTSIPAADRLVMTSASLTAADRGTESWVGYRATLSNLNGTNASTSNVGQIMLTRPSQVLSTTNQGQELCVNGSGSISYNNPPGTSLASITKTPSSDAPASMTDNETFTLVLTLKRTATDAYTLSYEIYKEGTPRTLFRAASGIASATGTKPSEMTQSFDALAIGMRNAGNNPDTTPGPIPRFVFSNLKVEYAYPVTAVPPSISTQPEGATVAVGAPFTLVAAASGSPTPTYQWFKNTGSGFVAIDGATSGSYSVGSASASDSATYKFVATNAVGSAESDVVTVTVGSAASAYDTWASAKGLTVANNAPAQDPDNDGVNNLLEFTLGGDPLASSTAILPVVGKSGANLTLTYNVEVAATEDYDIVPKISTDLTSTWAPVVHGAGGATIVETPVDADTDHVVVTVPATAARTFLRVEVAPKP